MPWRDWVEAKAGDSSQSLPALPQLREDDAKIKMAVVIGGVQDDGLADQRYGVCVVACLMGQQAEQVVGGGMLGVSLENLPAQSFRLLQVAALMATHGHIQ